ncbi:hypothetical protein C7974DRAFT_305165 [Boeremia exigua]|uniref:uncharacterized protein n=1 Tax=Boeremia exigua TaxID=749465 RepID=UPI001E8ED6A5|nr:uncharacterized protein C7974DRAFT_305165 [Boeremia exigua]KAH6639129.1 hypothetical protein C7974DRAFT_305165 [Boeremia exigua]
MPANVTVENDASGAAPTMISRLLLTPLEIRLEIYQLLLPDHVHICLQGNTLLLSKCLESDRDIGAPSFDANGPDTLHTPPSQVRYLTSDEAVMRKWAPRLGSAWGPHWKCEENALSRDPQSKPRIGLLLVCKQMYHETIRLLIQTATIHISDLDVIRHCSRYEAVHAQPNIPSALWQHATHVSISFRLPMAFCRALEQTGYVAPELSCISDSWTTLGSNLVQMPSLVRLTFWLDHDEPCPWALVGEQKIFSPLQDLFHKKNLEMSVSLPNLHPRYENTGRHFTNRATAPFVLYRRYRQTYHQVKSSNDPPQITLRLDFPFLFCFNELDPTLLGTIAEVEELERTWWADGMDVERFVEDFCSPRNEQFLI